MKALIGSIALLFTGLLAVTLVLTARMDEGLVERDYSVKADRHFRDREEEEVAGLAVRIRSMPAAGASRFAVSLDLSAGPLRGARATLHALDPGGRGTDRSWRLAEESPGRYAAETDLPRPGLWLFRLEVEGDGIAASRSWTAAVPNGVPAPGPDGALALSARSEPSGRRVALEISPAPVRPMRELTFSVRLPAGRAEGPVRIDLAMPGMPMPPNRVSLSREPDGAWRGSGILVRCPSGGRSWIARVTFAGQETARFPFDVAD